MSFSWWSSLPDEEKQRITKEANDRYDGKHCYWCGESLWFDGLGGRFSLYDHTSNIKDQKMICKGYCKSRRFFDNPTEEANNE